MKYCILWGVQDIFNNILMRALSSSFALGPQNLRTGPNQTAALRLAKLSRRSTGAEYRP